MRRICFLHTADLHLGSSLSIGGEYSAALSPLLDNAIYDAFSRLCAEAIDKQVDFVLISGDLYDGGSRSVKANIFFNQECEKLASHNIPVYIIAGNHDPLSFHRELIAPPENVHLFGGEGPASMEVYDQNGEIIANIIGCSYNNRAESRKVHLDYRGKAGIWNIGLLHTQLEAENNYYLPASIKELQENEEIHYWALGHLHQHNVLWQEKNRAIVYPGIPQGRDMGEEGPGGAVLVDLVPDSEPEIKYINLSSLIYQRIEIPVDSIQKGNLIDLQRLIMEIGEELLKNHFYLPLNNEQIVEAYIVDWVLTGRSEVSSILKREKEEAFEYLLNSLQETFISRKPMLWSRKIIDRTGMPIDESLIQNNSIYQDIEKIIFFLKENPDFQEELLEELGLIWSGDADHEELDPTLFHLNNTTLEAVLRQARQLILEELLTRRELA
ncbi:MAG TPA: DNA repair exonuclease [Halanaerobiaceae bacterium]|jgi:DNA repair exonuclease SbcCD nuclease subunit|nr:DNA repair exonuclease [Halanaerobiaceae bacterium]